MKYNLEIDIDAPLETVLKKFDSLDNLKEWQPGFESYELLSGEAGQVGAKTKLKYINRGREMEMVETIIKRDLPHMFSASYDAKGASSVIESRFEPLGDDKTRWHFFTEFHGSGIYKVMMILMPGAFKKQSRLFLNKFKEFAERD